MKFTDRFIKLPTHVYSRSLKELTNKEQYEETEARINPFDITDYYTSEIDGSGVTQICLRNMQRYLINLSIEDFENLLNQYLLEKINKHLSEII
jgi:uncharacterized protein (DUF2344 family)